MFNSLKINQVGDRFKWIYSRGHDQRDCSFNTVFNLAPMANESYIKRSFRSMWIMFRIT